MKTPFTIILLTLLIQTTLSSQTYIQLDDNSEDLSSEFVSFNVIDLLDLRSVALKEHIGTIRTPNGFSDIYYKGDIRNYFLKKFSSQSKSIPTPIGNGLIVVLRRMEIYQYEGKQPEINVVMDFFVQLENQFLKIDEFIGEEKSKSIGDLPVKIMKKALENIRKDDFQQALFTGYTMSAEQFEHYKERANEPVTISNEFQDGVYRFFNDLYFNPETNTYNKRILQYLEEFSGSYIQVGNWSDGKIILKDGLSLSGKIWGYVVNHRVYYRVFENNFILLTKYRNRLIYNNSQLHSYQPQIFIFEGSLATTILTSTLVDGIKKQRIKSKEKLLYLNYVYGIFTDEQVE